MVRTAAAVALIRLEDSANEAVPVLVEAMSDSRDMNAQIVAGRATTCGIGGQMRYMRIRLLMLELMKPLCPPGPAGRAPHDDFLEISSHRT